VTVPAFDLLVRGGTVVLADRTAQLDVGVRGGRIAALLPPGAPASGTRVVAAEGLHVLPGAIDIHFHVRAPAYPQRGTVESETRAAAAGGVTTVFEMPISKPCCGTPDVFRARREHFAARAHVNFGLYGAPGRLRRDEVQGMAAEGAIGFKIFMTSAPQGRDDEFDGLCLPDTPGLYEALRLVKETGLVVTVHAEDDALLAHLTAQLVAAGRNDPPAHHESRPPFVEATAIATLLTINQAVGARVHIAHVSSRHALDTLRTFQGRGDDVTGETCPQYLLFDQSALAEHGAYAKINPPLRTPDDIAALWAGVRDGSLIAITTDHSPFTVAEKEKARTDLWAAPPGAPGVEQLVIGTLDAVAAGRLTLVQAAQLLSTNGARRFGLYPRKGVVQEGADADLTLVDLDATTTIDRAKLFTEARDADRLYDGMTFRARVAGTILAGEVVFDGEEVLNRPGDGRFVRPLPATASEAGAAVNGAAAAPGRPG
jgi:dihydroorotase (multifunctional complex type)